MLRFKKNAQELYTIIVVWLQIVNVIAFKATWFSMRGFVKAPEVFGISEGLQFKRLGTQYFSSQKLYKARFAHVFSHIFFLPALFSFSVVTG